MMKALTAGMLLVLFAQCGMADGTRIAFSKAENMEVFARHVDTAGSWCSDNIEISLRSASTGIDWQSASIDQLIAKVGSAVVEKTCPAAQEITVYQGDQGVLLGAAFKNGQWAMIRDGANEEDPPTGEELEEENTTAETSNPEQPPADNSVSKNSATPQPVTTSENPQPSSAPEPVITSEQNHKVATPEPTTASASNTAPSNDQKQPSILSKILNGIWSLLEKLIHAVTSLFIKDPIDLVKNGRMDFDKSVTIGKALEEYKYFDKHLWMKTTDAQGRTIVRFTGRIDFKSYIGTQLQSGYSNIVLTTENISAAEKSVSEKDIKFLHIIDFSINDDSTFQIHRIYYASYNSKAMQIGVDVEDKNLESMGFIYKNIPDTNAFSIVYAFSH